VKNCSLLARIKRLPFWTEKLSGFFFKGRPEKMMAGNQLDSMTGRLAPGP
jgi:hypothetical protein